MREINFQEVGMQNYGPYIEPMTHTFVNDTLTLLTGPNGIGKTMSLDAIPFTLFGITSKGARGDDVVNNVTGKDCKTWVKFLVDSTQYKVTRYQKYKRRGNTVILNVNGVDTKSGHREVLPEIERILCPSKTFMNTLMFGQKVKDFFTDLGDADKKDIFRKILALEQYLKLYSETSNRLKSINNEISNFETDKKVKQGLLAEVATQLEYIKKLKVKFYEDQKRQIEDLKKSIDTNVMLLTDWNKTHDELKQKSYDLPSITKELFTVEEGIKNLDSKYKALHNDIDTGANQKKYEIKESANTAEQNAIKEATDTMNEISEKISEMKQNLADALQKNQKERYKISEEVVKLESDNESHEERISEIKKNVLESEISSCPTCEQAVNETTRKALVKKVEEHEKVIDNNHKKILILKESQYRLSAEMVEYSESVNKQINGLTIDKSEIQKQLDLQVIDIRKRLKGAFNKVDEIVKTKKDELEQQLVIEKEQLEKDRLRLSNVKIEAEKHNNEIQQVEKAIESISEKITVLKTTLQDTESQEFENDQLLRSKQRSVGIKEQISTIDSSLKDLVKRQDILEFWKTGFSSAGIPSMLIDEAVPFMNKRVSHYLDMLTNGRYIVSFDTLAETKAGEFRDKISVRVLDTHTQANTRVQLSGGQTRIIDIATILTLGDLQSNIQDVKFNLLLFDEIFDSLDDENIGYVTKVLNKIKVGKSIYVISHQHQDQVEADQNLTMSH